MDVVVTIVAVAVYLGTSVWVHRDARAIGVAPGQGPDGLDLGPTGWLVACLTLWMVAVPAYLIMRGDYQRVNGGGPHDGSSSTRHVVARGGSLRWRES